MKNKIACITGATAGIGKAAAYALAAGGARLILTGRRGERLNDIARDLKATFSTQTLVLEFDVRSAEAVKSALDGLPAEWKDIDILVNNAGLAAGLDPVQTASLDDWEQMIDTNIKGLLYMTREITPGMTVRRRGHIVNIGSIAGKEVYPNGSVYCATKHAVDALTKGMRRDLVAYGIKVSAIHPGAVETEFSLVRFKGDAEKAGKVYLGFEPLVAEDIAEALVFILTRPPHVNVDDLLIMPSAQASATQIHRTNQ